MNREDNERETRALIARGVRMAETLIGILESARGASTLFAEDITARSNAVIGEPPEIADAAEKIAEATARIKDATLLLREASGLFKLAAREMPDGRN